MLRNILLWIICAAGGALIGFHANKLGDLQNTALFVVGLMMVSLSLCRMGRISRRGRYLRQR